MYDYVCIKGGIFGNDHILFYMFLLKMILSYFMFVIRGLQWEQD